MNVIYDGKIFEYQAAGGINRYFSNLIDRLPGDLRPTLLTTHIRAVNFPSHPQLRVLQKRHRVPKPLRRLARRMTSRYFDRLAVELDTSADLWHPTYYWPIGSSEFSHRTAPVVLTVYDMIHERFAAMIDRNGTERIAKRRAIEAAAAIICISEHTKADLLDMYRLPEDRVHVTYLASDIEPPEVDPASDQAPYFLYVGSRAPYKNFNRLLTAFHAVAGRDRDIQLAVVGPNFRRSERQRIEDFNLAARVRHVGTVDDRQLANLYAGSVAFVYPSEYEGFGIPPLEAMRCRTPVIASNSSSIPEVVGDAALTFSPNNTDALIDHMSALLASEALRRDLIQRGTDRAQRFDWATTAEQTVDIYRRVAGTNRGGGDRG